MRNEMTPIASSSDLAYVRTLPHALTFILVNWSGPAIQAKIAVEQFLTEWRESRTPMTA